MEEETRRRVTQNLLDAGCEEALAQEFWRLFADGRRREGLALLAGHRRGLLDRCHAAQKEIDRLDYLVYQIENGQL